MIVRRRTGAPSGGARPIATFLDDAPPVDGSAQVASLRGQQTMRRLLQDILSGIYPPGGRIREVEVAERLGISRAPVREALRLLEQDGLIEILPWRGARVVDPSPDEIADLFDLLASVYGAVARFTVRHATDAQLERLCGDIVAYIESTQRSQDLIAQIDEAYRFGAHMGQACGNPLAANMLRRLGRMAYLKHSFLAPVSTRWRQQGVTRMRRLEAALRARSEDKSERAARKVIEHSAKLVVQHARAAHTPRGEE